MLEQNRPRSIKDLEIERMNEEMEKKDYDKKRMVNNLLKIFEEIRCKKLFVLDYYSYMSIEERINEILMCIDKFANIHSKMYEYKDCEIYNTNIILEILKYMGINTNISVENLNYVTCFKPDNDEEKECVYFDVFYSEEMFKKVIENINDGTYFESDNETEDESDIETEDETENDSGNETWDESDNETEYETDNETENESFIVTDPPANL